VVESRHWVVRRGRLGLLVVSLGRCCFAATTSGRVARAARSGSIASLWLVGRMGSGGVLYYFKSVL
jgi:hypothetical protein